MIKNNVLMTYTYLEYGAVVFPECLVRVRSARCTRRGAQTRPGRPAARGNGTRRPSRTPRYSAHSRLAPVGCKATTPSQIPLQEAD